MGLNLKKVILSTSWACQLISNPVSWYSISNEDACMTLPFGGIPFASPLGWEPKQPEPVGWTIYPIVSGDT